MSADGQGTNWRRNIAENFNPLNRAHERHRHTDDRQTGGQQHIAIAKKDLRRYVIPISMVGMDSPTRPPTGKGENPLEFIPGQLPRVVSHSCNVISSFNNVFNNFCCSNA